MRSRETQAIEMFQFLGSKLKVVDALDLRDCAGGPTLLILALVSHVL
jgi:hypothetical protein